MLVLIEGIDGSGKSTLCKQLINNGFDNVVISDGVDEFVKYKALKTMYKNSVLILDRGFVTDLVYRSIDLAPRHGMNLQEIAAICKDDVLIIHCKSDTAFEDSITRGEDNVTSKITSDKLSAAYDVAINILSIFSGIRTYVYNWKKNDVYDVIKFIRKEE
jgi:thymidylate kinase